MIKTVEQAVRNYAHKSLRAFLEGKQNLKWLLGVIESSEARGSTLAEFFENLRDHGNHQRYEDALSACRQQGWLP